MIIGPQSAVIMNGETGATYWSTAEYMAVSNTPLLKTVSKKLQQWPTVLNVGQRKAQLVQQYTSAEFIWLNDDDGQLEITE